MNKNQNQLIPVILTEQDLLVFGRKLREFLEETEEVDYVVEPRITALEVILLYDHGVLKSAGAQTGLVTTSIKTILSVPLTFLPLRKETPVPDYLEVSADVYMEVAAFSGLNQERRAKGLPAFSGPRAAVEDSLQQTDARISAKRPLNYFCSGSRNRAGVPAKTQYELMVALQEFGLRVNRPHLQVSRGMNEVIERCRRLKAGKRDFPYPVEGALIRLNSLDLQERLSRTSSYWADKIVFRF